MLNSEEEKKASKSEVYKSVRDQVVHEDNLVYQRFTWTLTSTGFLIAAYFLLLSSVDKFKEQKTLFGILLIFICFAGLTSCLFFRRELNKNKHAYDNLRNFWYAKYKEEGKPEGYNILNDFPAKEFPDVHHHNPLPKEKDRLKLSRSTNVVSNALMLLWLVLLTVGIGFILGPYLKENVKRQNSYPVIRRSTLGKDTTIYTDTLYLPK